MDIQESLDIAELVVTLDIPQTRDTQVIVGILAQAGIAAFRGTLDPRDTAESLDTVDTPVNPDTLD